MDRIIDFINMILWDYVLIYGLLGVGLYFTIRLRAIQFIHFPEFFRVIFKSSDSDIKGITPFQGLSVSLASRVGVGNITGVAVALNLGGPGAIFWMWIVALLGMATAYAESTLAQLYKVEDRNGLYRGGPAFYISRGLKKRWLGVVFSICLILSFGLFFNAVQSNAIAQAMNEAFAIPEYVMGLIIAGFAAMIIFGGLKSIAKMASKIVPIMAIAYLLISLYVVAIHITLVPDILWTIIISAFGFGEFAAGLTGGILAALLNGVKRGLFSNEAGMGSAPNIAASVTPVPHHPATQGFVQSLGVFIDTLIICTCTAIIILLSNSYGVNSDLTGTALTQNAMSDHVGQFGVYFVAIAILFFAFTSIIGNYTYAESAMTFMRIDGKIPVTILRLIVLAMVVWGALQTVQTVFNFADASMGLMASINLFAITVLSPVVVKLTRDYFDQRKAGKEPIFEIADYPQLQGKIDGDIWNDEGEAVEETKGLKNQPGRV